MTSPRRPLYLRALRVRYLRPRSLSTFVLFEGSIGLGALLALAEIIEAWGVAVIALAVALMVKLNDVVAGALLRPQAVAQLRTPRPSQRPAVGWSSMPSHLRPTTWIPDDDAIAHVDATPHGAARGVAIVPALSLRPARPPAPAPRPDESRPDGADGRSRGNTGRFED